MTPQFSEAVDPIFLHVLRLVEAIDRGEHPSAKDERLRIRGWIDQAEGMLGQGQEWQLAKYAIVAWIDDLLIEKDWEGREWWNENALEQELFGYRLAFTQFYLKAKEASTLPRRDALEVFYVCVVLGFRGLYRDPVEAIAEADRLELPHDLESWAKHTWTSIQFRQRFEPVTEAGTTPAGAPALEGQSFFISYLLIGVMLAAVNLVLLFFLILPSFRNY